jgi:signal transduction histidine kinase
MGLGLSVSRSVIEALGGRIEVDSRPARGSTFTAVFPTCAEASQEDTGDADTEPENPDR